MIRGSGLWRWTGDVGRVAVIVLLAWGFGTCGRTSNEPAGGSTPVLEHLAVKVEVLNGCGVPGIAGRYAELLRRKGFDVVNGNGENAENFGFLESVVVDRAGEMEKARAVAQALGIRHCVQQIRPDPYRIEEVTVIIGKDFDRLASS